MSVKILQGDCMETLPRLASESVHCVVTSPPYWGLRDYGLPGSNWTKMKFVPMVGLPPVRLPAWSGCLGLEPDPLAFVGHIVAVFRQVRRVLRNDGTCWMNFGDSYAGGGNGGGGSFARDGTRAEKMGIDKNNPVCLVNRRASGLGIKSKDLCGIPWRVALALQADGWYLRSDIIWHKPNPMPESCTDRPTKAHEYFFLLSKSERYFYDQEAIRETVTGTAHARGDGVNPKCSGWANGKESHRAIDFAKPGGSYKGSIPGRKGGPGQERRSTRPRQNESFSAAVNGLVSARNKRSVWTIATKGYKEAHFATFPPDLIRPCILAGTSERGACSRCGAPWERVIAKGAPDLEHQRACGGDVEGEYHGNAVKEYEGTGAQNASAVKARILEGMRQRRTVDWKPSCKCEDPRTVPCTVLDPFGGSGTTAAVAIEHGRRAVLCEMKPDYVKLSHAMLDNTQPGLF